MKQVLLFIVFSMVVSVALAQKGDDGQAGNCPGGCGGGTYAPPQEGKRSEISVYPNPAVDYFALNNDENVGSIVVFNTVGRKLRSFDAQKGEHYSVADLPAGVYLVQILNKSSKVIQTQRIKKA